MGTTNKRTKNILQWRPVSPQKGGVTWCHFILIKRFVLFSIWLKIIYNHQLWKTTLERRRIRGDLIRDLQDTHRYRKGGYGAFLWIQRHWIQSQGPQLKASSQQMPSELQKVFLQQQGSPTLEQTHTRNCWCSVSQRLQESSGPALASYGHLKNDSSQPIINQVSTLSIASANRRTEKKLFPVS